MNLRVSCECVDLNQREVKGEQHVTLPGFEDRLCAECFGDSSFTCAVPMSVHSIL